MVFGPPENSMQSFRLKSDVFYQFFPPVDYGTPCKDQSYPFRCAQSPCSNQHETSGVRITTAADSVQLFATEGPERTQGPNQIQAAVAYGRKEGCTTSPEAKKCQGTTAWHVLWHPKNNEDPGSVVWSWRFARKTIGFDKPVMVNNDKNESWFLVLKPLGFLWLSNLDTLFDHWIVSTPAWVFWFSTPNRSKNKIHHLAI